MDATARFAEAVAQAERSAPGSQRGARPGPPASPAGPASGAPRTEFARKGHAAAGALLALRRVILDAAEAYSCAPRPAGSLTGSLTGFAPRALTEAERDAFDAKVAGVLGAERGKVEALRDDVSALGRAAEGSAAAHKQAVVQALFVAVQEATKMASEMQLLRVRQTLATKRALYSLNSRGVAGRGEGAESAAAGVDRLVAENRKLDGLRHRSRGRRRPEAKEDLGPSIFDIDDDDDLDDLDDLDEETLQSLQTEQVALKSKLDEEMEGVRKAEKQMHELSQLVTIFNDKVMEQSESIDNIFQDVQTSTSFVDSATDQLLSAKEHNSAFRKYVVIFFAVATGMLILMDKMD